MRITFATTPARRKPQVGDRKLIGGVVHVRKFKMVRDFRGNIIARDCTGGKPRYEWVPAITKEKEA